MYTGPLRFISGTQIVAIRAHSLRKPANRLPDPIFAEGGVQAYLPSAEVQAPWMVEAS